MLYCPESRSTTSTSTEHNWCDDVCKSAIRATIGAEVQKQERQTERERNRFACFTAQNQDRRRARADSHHGSRGTEAREVEKEEGLTEREREEQSELSARDTREKLA